MADVNIVRMLIGDRKKAVTREIVCNAYDGTQLVFQLDMYPLASGKANGLGTGTVRLFTSGAELTETGTTIWSGQLGRFTLASAITAGANILADYTYYTLSSGEVTEFLSGHTGSPLLAAANACLVIAADYSRLGTYIQGNKTVKLEKVAEHLIDLSKELENKHYQQRDDTNFAADQWTMKDDTGTYYHGYDTAVAYLTGTS